MKSPKIKDLSWWEFDQLFNDVDYTIIGCGIVGISAAIEIKTYAPKAKVLILDRKRMPIGASSKNAGFACFGSVSEIYDDYQNLGEDVCRKLIMMRKEGLSILKSRVAGNDMDYRSCGGAEIFEEEEMLKFYESKLDTVNDLVSDIVGVESCFKSRNGTFGEEVLNTLEGSLNPQLMMQALELQARKLGVLFLFGIEIKHIDRERGVLESDFGEILYNQLIVCTNGFSRDLMPELDIKPARNQVLITNKIAGFNLNSCYHMDKGYIYFREVSGRLLIGGGRNLDVKGETTTDFGTTETIMDNLIEIVENIILKGNPYRIERAWSGILGVGASKMPIVRKIDDSVLVAARMGGMGLAIGSLIGQITSGMLLNIDNRALRLYVN